MSFDPQAAFANLAEKERVKGHHSPEGRAIRTLSRALNGWSAGNLSARDVLVLCDQAMGDWLKTSLNLSVWSTRTLPELLAMAVAREWITNAEAERLQRVRKSSFDNPKETNQVATDCVQDLLESCIQLVEKRW